MGKCDICKYNTNKYKDLGIGNIMGSLRICNHPLNTLKSCLDDMIRDKKCNGFINRKEQP